MTYHHNKYRYQTQQDGEIEQHLVYVKQTLKFTSKSDVIYYCGPVFLLERWRGG